MVAFRSRLCSYNGKIRQCVRSLNSYTYNYNIYLLLSHFYSTPFDRDVLNRACTDEKIEIPKKSIDFYNHPYRSIQYNVNSTVLQVECFESGAFYLLFLVLSIFSGFFAASIIRERVIGFKLLQQVEGLNMATFWLSHLLWDWMWLSILSILLLIIMYLIMEKEFNDETGEYGFN